MGWIDYGLTGGDEIRANNRNDYYIVFNLIIPP